MSKKKTSKEDLEKKLTQKLGQLNEKELFENLIKDNKIEFELENVKYRIHKPNQAESLDIRKARTKTYIELLRNDDYMLKEQLIELYKHKGVDIEKIELEIKEIGYKVEDVQQVLDKTVDKETIENLKTKIKDLFQKQSKLVVRVTELLEPCLENEILEFSNFYLVYLVLEKLELKKEIKKPVILNDNKWVKVFDTYQDFLNCENEQLISEAVYNLSLLIFKKDLNNE